MPESTFDVLIGVVPALTFFVLSFADVPASILFGADATEVPASTFFTSSFFVDSFLVDAIDSYFDYSFGFFNDYFGADGVTSYYEEDDISSSFLVLFLGADGTSLYSFFTYSSVFSSFFVSVKSIALDAGTSFLAWSIYSVLIFLSGIFLLLL